MKSKPSLIFVSLVLALALAGCSKKSKSSANNSTEMGNTNSSATTMENSNREDVQEPTTDDSTLSADNSNGTAPKTTREPTTANNNSAKPKPTPEKGPAVNNAEKQVKKQSDRAIRDAGGLLKEGERRVRGILGGKP